MRGALSRIADSLLDYLSDPKTRLPRRLSLREVTRKVRRAHSQYGGASIHLYFGDLEGHMLLAVSLYPERTSGRELPSELIAGFCRQSHALLQDPRLVVGTWYNSDEDVTYLDVTAVFVERQEAISLAEAYNQIAVYDLKEHSEIQIGGTGEEVPEMPQESQRLPPLARTEQKEK